MRGNLVWQASRLKEREYIYSLTSAELEEVDGALAFFKGKAFPLLLGQRPH